MTSVSDASIWIRLPDLVAGLVCWLLLSREVLPRLGAAVASSKTRCGRRVQCCWRRGCHSIDLRPEDLSLTPGDWAHVMTKYPSQDWGPDWGSLRKFATIVETQPAQLDFGTATHGGLWKAGEIRIGP